MKSFVGGEDREEDGGCNAMAILARFSANTSQQKENTAYGSHASSKKASGELTIPHQAPSCWRIGSCRRGRGNTYVKPSATKPNMIAVVGRLPWVLVFR